MLGIFHCHHLITMCCCTVLLAFCYLAADILLLLLHMLQLHIVATVHVSALSVQVFTEVFSREHQLMKVDPRKFTYLACCLLMRGRMSIADMNRNVTRLKPNLRMVHWNTDGFKLGICSTPPVGKVIPIIFCSSCCRVHAEVWACRIQPMTVCTSKGA